MPGRGQTRGQATPTPPRRGALSKPLWSVQPAPSPWKPTAARPADVASCMFLASTHVSPSPWQPAGAGPTALHGHPLQTPLGSPLLLLCPPHPNTLFSKTAAGSNSQSTFRSQCPPTQRSVSPSRRHTFPATAFLWDAGPTEPLCVQPTPQPQTPWMEASGPLQAAWPCRNQSMSLGLEAEGHFPAE